MSRVLCATIVLLSLIVVSVIGCNWNRVSVRRYEMNVALDGKAPWGLVGPEATSAHAPTVLYRKVGESYCYTAIQLPSLRDRLEREGKPYVTVEYNVFTHLGYEGRYTLRSVDGVVLANGNRILQKTEESGGQALAGNEDLGCP
ncbi:hypothetical protein [Terracidiphilus sp.]|uniref:hypothetical protein n=1 Tax=Terracidiphilus sp. TaxID=1964191 RepID=UPI003C215F68